MFILNLFIFSYWTFGKNLTPTYMYPAQAHFGLVINAFPKNDEIMAGKTIKKMNGAKMSYEAEKKLLTMRH